jgi:hypothetical protein
MSTLVIPPDVSAASVATRTASSLFLPRLVRLIVLVALFSGASVYEAAHVSAVSTPEVWSHLRTGMWIVQSRSIPHSGLFSQSANLTWNDSTWGFDAVLAVMYHFFGLRAIPILLMVFKAALAIVTFSLARAGRAKFWSAVVLSAVAQYVLRHLQPLPYVFSILFFAVELRLLTRSRQTGAARDLFWLPFLFVIWANLHIQFVAGLLLLALFLIAGFVEEALRKHGVTWLNNRIHPLPLKHASIVAALSLLATLLTPYSFHLLPRAFGALYSHVAFEHFSEMASMSFRRPQEFALMLLVMTAFLALGRRRSLSLFELLALLAGTLVAFRIQRDGWLAVLPALAVLSDGFLFEDHERESSPGRGPGRELGRAAALTVAAVVIAAFCLPGQKRLMDKMNPYFPVKACDYIRENRLPQPLFNAYTWGSFITWYLPEYPVTVDSRVELYGNDMLAEYFDIIGGKKLLESEPMVAHAGTLLLERQSAMAKALTNLPALSAQYRLVYSDDIASVFVPQHAPR